MQKNVLISGVTGQLGSQLCRFYLNKGDLVYGIRRRSSLSNMDRIQDLIEHPNLKLLYGDLTDAASIFGAVATSKPDYFINCAAQSFVQTSFDCPIYTADVTGTGVITCWEAVRQIHPKTKCIQLSSSEIFGDSSPPQNENTLMMPASPYGVAKLSGYHYTKNYRESYGLWLSNIIAFNYESKLRGPEFVTKKIVHGLCQIKKGVQDKLQLGNLEAKRDWISMYDVVDGIDLILHSQYPDDYCLASGKSYSVQEFLEKVANRLDIDWRKCVEIDLRLIRPKDVPHLCGDYSKIKNKLGWEPKWTLDMIIDEMIKSEYN